jgi:hypothetical protein
MMSKINEKQLIKKLSGSSKLLHLAKTPITNKDQQLIFNHPQLYVFGYNVGGRPDGLWVSYGSKWMELADGILNPTYPVCCYLYEIKLNKDANVLRITSDSDFEKLDSSISSYWVNFDYFEMDFVDSLTHQHVVESKKYKLDLTRIIGRADETLKETLIRYNIIFDNPKTALKVCTFYKKSNIPIERFKYKDWSELAKKYHGVLFDNYNRKNKKLMEYFWFQSLDLVSGCIWNISAIDKINLVYNKINTNTWNKHK